MFLIIFNGSKLTEKMLMPVVTQQRAPKGLQAYYYILSHNLTSKD